ncbi:SDR family oxidoreductase [Lapillicoccus jejuensis]|uniref:Uncharacterized protein YbjT (DUF2867 family) n=1 Tax=Lapillicoccus jejuensis TaxID=402171 RepID=A0A542E692_9MICO|nr:NAD(P)H-binding protein [Lapillicoccus jejuensis]TQJ10853.1 uncharacterized protein YbjT (DUF2867 family) [Lapillicoccus jejuensis]
MRIGVAGATGTVGRLVARTADDRGHEVVPLARSLGVDLSTGDGLRERLHGVDAVVDVTNVSTQRRSVAEDFFTSVTGHLLAAEQAAGVGHHVLLSIVGIDDVPSGYYLGKVAQEAAVRAGPTPWSILRATQFHEFAEQMLDVARVGRTSLVPDLLSQTVAAADVAKVLVDAVERGPRGRLVDLGGPAVARLPDLSRRLVGAVGEHRRVVPLPLPGRTGRLMREGALLPRGRWRVGDTTFEAWLTERAARPGG